MRDATEALDAYLQNRFGITLERALTDAAAGVVSLALHGSVDIACDPVGRFEYDDEGVSDRFQALLRVENVTYRCHFVIFTDGGGERYVETIGDLEVVKWRVKLIVPQRPA